MPTIAAKYKTSDGDVFVDIIIGDAQAGVSAVAVSEIAKQTVTAVANGSSIKRQRVGAGPGLKGSILVASVTVEDVRQQTDWTSATLIVSGGSQDGRWSESEKVATPGGKVNYLFAITFE